MNPEATIQIYCDASTNKKGEIRQEFIEQEKNSTVVECRQDDDIYQDVGFTIIVN